MGETPGPGLATTVWLLTRLRFRLLWRQIATAGWLGGLLSALLLLAMAGALGVASYLLFTRVTVVTDNRSWRAFFLGLFCFLLGVFWILWPLVAAQVDDAYELGRYLHFPVQPARLYLAQTLVGLCEPAVIFFYPALIGAGLGLAETVSPGGLPTAGLMICFALMNVALGRALLNLFLNVMASRRSAEILFAAFLLGLGLAAILPPVDTSWFYEQMDNLDALGAEDLSEIIRAAGAMTDTPPGWLAHGLRAAIMGRHGTVWRTALGMLAVGAVAWTVGLILLKRFYRGGRSLRRSHRRVAPPRPISPGPRLPGLSQATACIFHKEWRTLTGNPKGRMLFAVPFFLVILLKLVGAAQLFQYLWGDTWASLLLAGVLLYVLAVLSGQFFVNGFGYDGPAVRLVYLLPPPPSAWIVGRNLAQGLFASVQALGLAILVLGLLPGASVSGLLLPVCTFIFGLLCLLASGNLLSARFPRRYHLSLGRRDRPVGASFVWALITLAACTALAVGAIIGAAQAGLPAAVALLPLPLLGASVWAVLLPVASRWTRLHREQILSAIGEGSGFDPW